MIKVKDGRGQNKKNQARKNFQKIRKWFSKNPNSTISDCCSGTGLTYKTVKKHLKAMV